VFKVAVIIAVNDAAMLEYIRNKTAAPYFSNLVWFIGSHVIELDECIRRCSQAELVLLSNSIPLAVH